MRSFLFYISLCSIGISYAQPSIHALEKYIQEENSSTPPNIIFEDTRNEIIIISTLKTYTTDPSENIRKNAYSLLSRIGQKSKNDKLILEIVEHISSGLEDSSNIIRTYCIKTLQNFSKQDFNLAAKSFIHNSINDSCSDLNLLMKMAGFLEMEESEDKINQIINNSDIFTTRWAARIALARMGDRDAIDYINTKLKKAVINDAFVYDIAPDLIYTRNDSIFKFLKTQLLNKKKNCLPADPDSNQPIQCGYRLMENMAYAIDNFPLKKDKNGELQISDYKKGLEELRLWIEKGNDFKINRDIY